MRGRGHHCLTSSRKHFFDEVSCTLVWLFQCVLFWWRRFFHFVSLFCCVKGYKKDKVVHLHIMFTHFEPIKVMPPPLFYAGWTLFSGSVMSSCVERWDNHRQLAVGKKKTYSLHLENIVILITKRYEHSPSNSNGNNWLDHTIQCGFLCKSVFVVFNWLNNIFWQCDVLMCWEMKQPPSTGCQEDEIIFHVNREYCNP